MVGKTGLHTERSELLTISCPNQISRQSTHRRTAEGSEITSSIKSSIGLLT